MFRKGIVLGSLLGFLSLVAAPAQAAHVRQYVPTSNVMHVAKASASKHAASKLTKGKKPKIGKKHHHKKKK